MKEIFNIKYKLKTIACIFLILMPIYPFILFKSFSNDKNNIIRENKSLRKNDFNEAINKIDPDLLDLLNASSNKASKIPIIILYNYHDEHFKQSLRENTNGIIYDYKIIPASFVYSANFDMFSIINSPAVKKVFLDKKVYPISIEKKEIISDFSKEDIIKNPYFPLVNESSEQIGAPYLWDLKINGSGVLVAVLDTGIDKTHADLNDLDDNPTTNDPKVIYEKSLIDFDYNEIPEENAEDLVGHGTHVAGIISGTGEALSYKFKGIAPGSKLMNVKVLTTYGGYISWVIKGIEYATYGDDEAPNTEDDADIISMSLGGNGFIDDPVIQAVEAAWNLNKTVVIAAGNSGEDFFTIESPGLSTKAITVGAVDNYDRIADFSSRGPSPDLSMGIDICAPGVNIISARAKNTRTTPVYQNYTSMSGTSMSTPFVAGAVALLIHSDPTLVPTAIKTAIMATAIDMGESNYIQGAGRIDVYAAYNLINNISGGSRTLLRLNTTDLININSENIYANIKPGFYFDFLGDWHRNEHMGVASDALREMFFAIRYNVSEEQKYYTSSELFIDYPYEMRMLVYNTTHKIAIESLKTPDENLKIDIFYEYFYDSKWIRVSFNITSLCSQNINNVKFYLYMDPRITYNRSDDGEFIQNINALVANGTYYEYNLESTINDFFGFSSINKSIAFDVGDQEYVYDKLDTDTLANNTFYHGDVTFAQEWLNKTIITNNHAFIPIIFAFGNNRSDFIDNINEGKTFPTFKLNNPDIAINTLLVSNPTYKGNKTYLNISLINVGYSQSASFNVSTFINNIKINQTEINGINPGEKSLISIPVVFNKTCYHDICIIADYSKDEFENANSNNKMNRKINVILPILATFFPHSPLDNPMTLKYAGQYIYWNCFILQGEKLSDLKLNKTGMAKSFVSFDGKSSSTNDISIIEGINHYNINISINIPKGISGLFDFSLQLLNSSLVLSEIPIRFNILKNLPAQLIIINSTIEDDGLEDDDGIVEGEEIGNVNLCIKSVNSTITTYIFDPFLIISSRNDSSIDLLTYRVLFGEYMLSANETSWNDEYYPFVFNVPYNFLNLRVSFSSIVFAQVDSSEDYVPFFQSQFNFTIQQRVSGIPDLEFSDLKTADLNFYDENNIVEPGEVGIMGVNFKNVGSGSALQIFNTNFTCRDSRVFIPQPYYVWQIDLEIFIIRLFIPTLYIQWNGIDPGDITKTYDSLLVFNLSSSIPAGTSLIFELEIEYRNVLGDNFKEKIQFTYLVPSINNSGNGDDDDDGGDKEINPIILAVAIGIVIVTGSAASILFFYLRKRKLKILKRKFLLLKQ